MFDEPRDGDFASLVERLSSPKEQTQQPSKEEADLRFEVQRVRWFKEQASQKIAQASEKAKAIMKAQAKTKPRIKFNVPKVQINVRPITWAEFKRWCKNIFLLGLLVLFLFFLSNPDAFVVAVEEYAINEFLYGEMYFEEADSIPY